MSEQAKELEVKDLGALEIKDAEKGEVEAVIATIGVVDREGDIITASAIKSGAKVKVSAYGHDAVFGAIPVGHGTISVQGDKAVFKGRLFLSTARGKETFDVLKEMGGDQEWSFGFRVMGSEVPDEEMRKKGAHRVLTKLDAFEVSPVIYAAGVGTRTLSVKGADEPPPETVEPPVDTTTEDEAKRAEEEAARMEAERKQAEIDAQLKQVAADEFDRFLRTQRRLGAA